MDRLLISESIGMVYMSTGDGSPKVAVYGDLSTIDWIPTDFKKNVAYNLSPNKNITSLFLPHNIQLSEHDLNIPSLYDGISYVTWLENDYLTTGEYYFTSKQMLSDEKILKITNLFEEREFILKGLKLNDNIFKDHPLLTLGIFISILAIVLYSIRSVYELINLHPLLQQYWLYNATPIIIMKYFVCSIAILPKQLTDEELETIVKDAINEVHAQSMKDMGRIMGKVNEVAKGRVDGKRINEMVKKLLA